MKIKTIKRRIIVSTLLIVLIPLVILGTFSCISTQYTTLKLATENMVSTAELAGQRVQWELESFIVSTEEVGCNAELANENTSDKRRQEIIDMKVLQYGMDRGCVINKDGLGSNGIDYSDREYFKNAMNGKTTVTEPMFAKSTGKMAVIVAAPLWDNGVAGKKAVGCVYFVPHEEFLNDIVRDLKVSENSTAYILGRSGIIIADSDSEVVTSQQSYITLAEEDSGYGQLAEVNWKMIAGEDGSDTIKVKGKSTLIGYAPIEGTDGWSIAVSAPSMDYLESSVTFIFITIAIALICAIICSIDSAKTGRSIGDPVAQCTERLRLLSEGDLSSPVPQINTNDETKILAEATERLVGDMNSIIGDIGRMLNSMANGDFNVSSSCGEDVYRGDFHVLIESVSEINHKLSSTIAQINTSADQVSTGSDQVSGGAQSLSQGATEQASSIEELTSTVLTISDKVKDTAENCINGKELTEESAGYINEATECMGRLTDAMHDISDASNEISRIIKAIEDIAFQTNILALNASVEAARAGSAGKGFTVVADEVRNLAGKSAEAAKRTSKLINETAEAVASGAALADSTAKALSDAVEDTARVDENIGRISGSAKEQSEFMDSVFSGINAISQVVSSTSDNAQSGAASSEELSGQASMLSQLVSGFKL